MNRTLLLIALFAIVILTPACSSVAGNSPVRTIPEARSTVTGLKAEFLNSPILCQAVYNGQDELDLFQYKEGWLDPREAINKSADRLHQESGGMPKQTILYNMRQMDKYKLLFLLDSQDLVVYRVGVDVPPELMINFNQPGALTLTMTSQEVADHGIIVPSDFSPISNWADSRRQVATLSRGSNDGKPAGWPNIIFVLMPRSSYGQRVTKVTTSAHVTFSGHAALALK